MTPALLATTRGAPDSKTLRRALTGWAFNTKRRDGPKLSGSGAGVEVAGVELRAGVRAHELKLLTANRLSEVKWTAPKTVRAIDKRVVSNPQQAKSLLSEVEAQRIEGQPRRSSGPMLVAFLAVMYYVALRPEEAAMLRKADLQLPEEGWGELLLSETAPITGAAWTDSGERRDRRQPTGGCSGNLVGGDLAESTIGRVWDKARKARSQRTSTPRRWRNDPYDLQHACVSTWLAAGVPSTQCAEWAGHSVAVLHQIYAKVIAGLESAAHDRIEKALGRQS